MQRGTLAYVLTQLGLTVKTAEPVLGVDRSSISRYLRSETKPSTSVRVILTLLLLLKENGLLEEAFSAIRLDHLLSFHPLGQQTETIPGHVDPFTTNQEEAL